MLNYNFINQKAKESQIDNVTIEREYWQLLWLQRLYLLPSAKNLYFKGGTAIRFLFQSFRFSEDLDFTATVDKHLCQKTVFDAFAFFKKNSPTRVDLKEDKVSRQLQEISLRYRFLFFPQNASAATSIRLDLSLREKPLTHEENVLVPFDYPISPYPLLVHLSAEEILAEKIRAVFVRGKPRDLFDLWFLLSKQMAIKPKIIESKFKLYPKLTFSLEKLKQIVKDYSEDELKKDLNQFLPMTYRSFYKKLKPELLEFLKK